MPRAAQVERDGLAITVERRGTSSGIALRHLSRPWLHVRSAKDHTGKETALRSLGLRGRTLKTIRTEVPGGPHTSSRPNYTWGTPGINNCGGPIRRFPFRYWGNLFCAYWSPWPTSRSASVMGLSGRAKRYYFSYSLSCNWDSIFTRVSDRARISLTPFGKGYTEQGPCLCFYEYGALPFSPFNWSKCTS